MSPTQQPKQQPEEHERQPPEKALPKPFPPLPPEFPALHAPGKVHDVHLTTVIAVRCVLRILPFHTFHAEGAETSFRSRPRRQSHPHSNTGAAITKATTPARARAIPTYVRTTTSAARIQTRRHRTLRIQTLLSVTAIFTVSSFIPNQSAGAPPETQPRERHHARPARFTASLPPFRPNPAAFRTFHPARTRHPEAPLSATYAERHSCGNPERSDPGRFPADPVKTCRHTTARRAPFHPIRTNGAHNGSDTNPRQRRRRAPQGRSWSSPHRSESGPARRHPIPYRPRP